MEDKKETDGLKLPAAEENTPKSLKNLNLIDDYMFDVTTLDIKVCRYIVELSMNIKVQDIRWKEGQKVVHNLPGKRGIRLDFYVEDIEDNIFNVEMQVRKAGHLPKRTRFYKALLDSPLLKSGEKGFDRLPPTYVIFICGFDQFGYGKYRYTFHSVCEEVPGLVLEDECATIFLNTKGENAEEVESSLVHFMRFVENSTKEIAEESGDERIQYIYERMEELKKNSEMEADYMKTEERERLMKEEAEKRGELRGRQLERYDVLKRQISRMRLKGYQTEEIGELLGEESGTIREIMREIEE